MSGHGAALGGMMREIDHGQLLASIAATLHDCLLSLDADGTVLWSSPATEQVLGWRADELAGRPLSLLFPGDAERRDSALSRLLAGDHVDPFVETAARRDGATFSALVTLGPVHGPDGGTTGAIVVLRDVTAELAEQHDLALALELSRAHFDQASVPQAIVGLDGRLESVNPAWCELFGRGEGWFADSHLLDLVHPVDADPVVQRLTRLEAGEIESISYRGLFRDADGQELRLLLDASLLREADGRPYAIAASVADADEYPEDDGRPNLPDVLARRAWDSAVVLDEQLTMTYVAGAVARMLGFDRDQLLHHSSWEYLHPGDVTLVAELVDRVLAEPRRHERAVLRLRDGEGQWRSIEATITNCLADPDVLGLVANLRDVTERVATEEALRLSEALHRAMVETAQEGILATSPEGLVIFANATAARVLGRAVEDIKGEDPVRLLGLVADGTVGEDGREVHEVVHRRPDNKKRILRVSVRPLNSRNSRLGSLISVSDVTDARNAERVLRSRALHDPLTALPNRYLFQDRLETAAARQARSPGRGTAVLFLDVDRFKRVNDGYGHAAGDGVLREVAARLLASVRATDTVGRLGGDEFAVVCEDSGRDEALVVAHRILAAFEAPVDITGGEHPVAVSIGIALAPPYEVDDVVHRADEAMYRAKQAGGGRLALAGEDLDPA
jgi:diguanylate cyclase (GGDEF)-like protein/PAS domain S-box-containing protein